MRDHAITGSGDRKMRDHAITGSRDRKMRDQAITLSRDHGIKWRTSDPEGKGLAKRL